MMSPPSLISYACNRAWPNAVFVARSDPCGCVTVARGDSSQGKGPYAKTPYFPYPVKGFRALIVSQGHPTQTRQVIWITCCFGPGVASN